MLVKSKLNRSRARSALNLRELHNKHLPQQLHREATNRPRAGLARNLLMDQTRLKPDKKSAQLGKLLVTGAAPKDTSPKPVPSVYIALPGDTKARGVKSAPNPRKKLMKLEN